MAASISSVFNIVVDQTIAAGTSVTVTNPGRPFKVVSVFVTGLNGAVCSVARSNGGTISSSTLASGDLNDFPSAITVGNVLVDSNVNLIIGAVTANVTRVVIVCEAGAPQALTVS